MKNVLVKAMLHRWVILIKQKPLLAEYISTDTESKFSHITQRGETK